MVLPFIRVLFSFYYLAGEVNECYALGLIFLTNPIVFIVWFLQRILSLGLHLLHQCRPNV